MAYYSRTVRFRDYFDVPSVPSDDGTSKLFRVTRGQQAILNDHAGLLFVVLRDRRKIRLPGVALSDTVRLAARGRRLAELISHPLLEDDAPGGEALITHIRPESRQVSYDDIVVRWETVRLRSPLPAITDRNPPWDDLDEDYVPF